MPPRQQSRAGRGEDDDDVPEDGEDGGPDVVVWELAPAALVHDGSLVGDAAEEIDGEEDDEAAQRKRLVTVLAAFWCVKVRRGGTYITPKTPPAPRPVGGSPTPPQAAMVLARKK